MDLFTLVAKLTLDTKEYTDNMAEAESKGSSFADNFEGVIERVKSALAAAGIVTAIKGIADQFQRMINNTAQYADTVDKGAQRLSISTDAYQEWDHALSQSGAGIEAITRGILNLNKAAGGDATEDVAKALNSLNIDPTQFEKTEDLLDVVFNTLADMEAGVERDNLVTAIFGRGGAQLNAFLNAGSKGIAELREEAKELGLVMSGDEIANGVAYGDAVANLNAALEAIKQTLVASIIPMLTDAVEFVTQIISFFNGRTYKDSIDEITDANQEAVNAANSDAIKATGIIEYMQQLVEKYGEAATQTSEWALALGDLEAVLPGITDVLGAQYESVSDLTAALKDYVQANKEASVASATEKAVKQYEEELSQATVEQAIAAARVESFQYQQQSARDAMTAYIQDMWQKAGNQGTFADYVAAMGGDMDAYSMKELKDIALGLMDQWYMNQQAFAETNEEMDQLNLSYRAQQNSITNLMETYGQAENEAKNAAEKAKELAEKADKAAVQLQVARDALAHLAGSSEALANSMDGSHVDGDAEPEGSYAKGLNYVPYDNYVAELHRGEMVLNQAQAQEYRQGSGFDADMMYQIVAEAVASAVADIQINMDGAAVGNAVTKQVSRNIYQAQYARRFTTV